MIFIGVPEFNPCGFDVVTVIIAPGVNPSPDMIFEILIGSAANAPTISNSGLCGENPASLAGYLSVVSIILSVELNALDNLA